MHVQFMLDQALKGTVVNRTCHSKNKGSLETTFIVPLNFWKISEMNITILQLFKNKFVSILPRTYSLQP